MVFFPPKSGLIAGVTLAASLATIVAAPLPAQTFIQKYEPIDLTTYVTGPYKPYLKHVLKISDRKYDVLFAAGFADESTARNTIAPLCGGKTAQIAQGVPPVDLVYEGGEAALLHAIRVFCD